MKPFWKTNFWNIFASISIWVVAIVFCFVFLHNCNRPQFFTVSLADEGLTNEIVERKGVVDWSQLTVDSLNVVHLAEGIDSASYITLRNNILREEMKTGRLMTAEQLSEKITGYYDKLIDVLIALFILFTFVSYFVIGNRFRKQYEDDKTTFAEKIKLMLMETLPHDDDLLNGITTKIQEGMATEEKVEQLRDELSKKIEKSNDDFELLAGAYDELTELVDSKREVENTEGGV